MIIISYFHGSKTYMHGYMKVVLLLLWSILWQIVYDFCFVFKLFICKTIGNYVLTIMNMFFVQFFYVCVKNLLIKDKILRICYSLRSNILTLLFYLRQWINRLAFLFADVFLLGLKTDARSVWSWKTPQ